MPARGASESAAALDQAPTPVPRDPVSDDKTATTLHYVDRRIAPRYVFKVPTKVILAYNEGTAMLWDISASGARVEQAGVTPVRGEKLRIEFSFFEDSPPVELKGEVVRISETGGFSMKFLSLSPRMKQILTRLLPKIASSRMQENQLSSFDRRLQANLGPVVYPACADAARAAGVELNVWMKEVLEKAAMEAAANAHRGYGGPGHDPSSCLECRGKTGSG